MGEESGEGKTPFVNKSCFPFPRTPIPFPKKLGFVLNSGRASAAKLPSTQR